MKLEQEFIADTITKNDGITVRIWCRDRIDRPLGGHYSYKFSYEEAPTRDVAFDKAIEL